MNGWLITTKISQSSSLYSSQSFSPPRTTMMPSTLTTDLDDLSSSLNSSVESLLNASSTASENSVQFLFCPDRVEPLFKTEKEEHFQFSFYPLKEIAISASSKILGYRYLPNCRGYDAI